VLSQVDFTIAHRQPEPASAEQLSRLCGTRMAWSVTERTGSGIQGMLRSRQGTRTRVHEFTCHPGEFKRLGVGEAIVIEPGARQDPEIVRVWPLSGESVELTAGDTAFFAEGTRVLWEVQETVRKAFHNHDRAARWLGDA
jgi:hypothetical protein